MGEFGRTPKISPRGGRDHFPRAFNVAPAGGGIQDGQVISVTNPDGTAVKDRPVAINDLLSPPVPSPGTAARSSRSPRWDRGP